MSPLTPGLLLMKPLADCAVPFCEALLQTYQAQVEDSFGSWSSTLLCEKPVSGAFAGGAVGFEVVGVGEFNGDGRVDILACDLGTGTLGGYLMNGFQVLGVQLLGAVGLDFTVLGGGDLNGDGRADIVFPRTSGGLLAAYLVNGFPILGAQSLGVLGLDWGACYGQPPLSVAQGAIGPAGTERHVRGGVARSVSQGQRAG